MKTNINRIKSFMKESIDHLNRAINTSNTKLVYNGNELHSIQVMEDKKYSKYATGDYCFLDIRKYLEYLSLLSYNGIDVSNYNKLYVYVSSSNRQSSKESMYILYSDLFNALKETLNVLNPNMHNEYKFYYIPNI